VAESTAQRVQIVAGKWGVRYSGTHPPAPQPLDWGALGGDVEGVGVRTPHVDAEHVGAVVVAAALVPPGRRLGLLPPSHRRAASSGEMTPHPSPICSHIPQSSSA